MQASEHLSRRLACTDLARETLWMPLSIEGSDEAFHDGFVAALAVRSIILIVALTTESFAVFFMKTFWTKLLPTQRAKEVLRVPGLVQGTHHSLEEGRQEEMG